MARSDLLLRLGLSIAGLKRGLTQAERELGSSFRRINRLSDQLTTRLTLPIAGAATGAISAFAGFQRLEIGLRAVVGSAGQAAAQMNELKDIVADARTTLALPTAVEGATQLQAVGVNAQLALDTIEQLGVAATVFGASSQDIEEVVRQLSQSAATGKVLGQELRIIEQRIPGLSGIIKDEFGGATAEAIRGATANFDEFLERLVKASRESRVLQGAQGGLGKAFDDVKIQTQLALIEFGRAIDDAFNLTKNITRLAKAIGALRKGFEELSPVSKNTIVIFGGILAIAGPLLKAINLLRFGIKALTLVFASNPIGLVVVALTALVAAFIAAWENSERFRIIVRSTFNVLRAFGEIITQEIVPAIGLIAEGLALAFNPLRAGEGLAKLRQGTLDLLNTIGETKRDFALIVSDSFDLAKNQEAAAQATRKLKEELAAARQVQTTPTGGGGTSTPRQAAIDLSNVTTGIIAAGQAATEQTAFIESKAADVGNAFAAAGAAVTGTFGAVTEGLTFAGEELQRREEEMKRFTTASLLAGEAVNIIGKTFEAVVINGQNFGKVLGQIFRDLLAQLVKLVAQAVIFAAIFAAVGGGGFGAAFSAVTGTGQGGGGIIQFLMRGFDFVAIGDANRQRQRRIY